jgi:hypothetical protein
VTGLESFSEGAAGKDNNLTSNIIFSGGLALGLRLASGKSLLAHNSSSGMHVMLANGLFREWAFNRPIRECQHK